MRLSFFCMCSFHPSLTSLFIVAVPCVSLLLLLFLFLLVVCWSRFCLGLGRDIGLDRLDRIVVAQRVQPSSDIEHSVSRPSVIGRVLFEAEDAKQGARLLQ